MARQRPVVGRAGRWRSRSRERVAVSVKQLQISIAGQRCLALSLAAKVALFWTAINRHGLAAGGKTGQQGVG